MFFFFKAALSPIIFQSVLIARIAPDCVQYLAFGFVVPGDVHTGPLLESIQVPLDDLYLVPLMCQLYYSAWYCLQTC